VSSYVIFFGIEIRGASHVKKLQSSLRAAVALPGQSPHARLDEIGSWAWLGDFLRVIVRSNWMVQKIVQNRSLVGGLEHFLFVQILGIIIPTD
jgi:hypothetical protein